jgi:hypothetical protein
VKWVWENECETVWSGFVGVSEGQFGVGFGGVRLGTVWSEFGGVNVEQF